MVQRTSGGTRWRRPLCASEEGSSQCHLLGTRGGAGFGAGDSSFGGVEGLRDLDDGLRHPNVRVPEDVERRTVV